MKDGLLVYYFLFNVIFTFTFIHITYTNSIMQFNYEIMQQLI